MWGAAPIRAWTLMISNSVEAMEFNITLHDMPASSMSFLPSTAKANRKEIKKEYGNNLSKSS
jgi:hypothetical protein